MIATIPSFSRVEIRTGGKADLRRAASELKHLAGELETLADKDHDEPTAVILAHHTIKATSQKLRGK